MEVFNLHFPSNFVLGSIFSLRADTSGEVPHIGFVRLLGSNGRLANHSIKFVCSSLSVANMMTGTSDSLHIQTGLYQSQQFRYLQHR